MKYCPSCMNDTLHINTKGTIHVIINNKQMDSGRFLFNLAKNREEQWEDLKDKLEDFCRWYGGFDNKEPISKVDIISCDFTCEKGCRLDLNYKASVVDLIIPRSVLHQYLEELCERFELELNI